jgi:phosphomevalonate kinase
MIATAPGKLILTGEYAVLDGAPALVMAIDRRVVARRGTPHERSPYLEAVAAELDRRGSREAAAAARTIIVDSSALYDRDTKLGLGSSAAVTVAATALALAHGDERERTLVAAVSHSDAERRWRDDHRDAWHEVVYDIARTAHATAQGARGARGSGADVSAAVHGGLRLFNIGSPVHGGAARQWPPSLALLPFFTGHAADTATLVAAVERARAAHPDGVGAALAAIRAASLDAQWQLGDMLRDGGQGTTATAIRAFDAAGAAIDQLAAATGVDLVPPCVTAARSALRPLGGTAKTTGAGGGDVAIAVIPATIDVTAAHRLLIEAGCRPLQLQLDETGVDFAPAAQ